MIGKRRELRDLIYKLRKQRKAHPLGKFRKNGQWDPDPQEEWQECCGEISPPSKRYPYSYMSHCRTKKHITNLVNSFDDKKVDELLGRLDNKYIQIAFCPYCGSIKVQVYPENKRKQWPKRLFCCDCHNIVPLAPLTPEPKKEEVNIKISQTDLISFLDVDFSDVTYQIETDLPDGSEEE